MLNLKIVIASTRPTRMADRVAPWVVESATLHGAFDVEVLDLRDWPLPMFQEHIGTIGDFIDPTYSEPIVREWNRKLKGGCTAGHHRRIPALHSRRAKERLRQRVCELRIAQQTDCCCWLQHRSRSGCTSCRAPLRRGDRVRTVSLRDTVLISRVESAFDDQGVPNDFPTRIAMSIMLDDLAWWGELLVRTLQRRAATGRVPGEGGNGGGGI